MTTPYKSVALLFVYNNKEVGVFVLYPVVKII